MAAGALFASKIIRAPISSRPPLHSFGPFRTSAASRTLAIHLNIFRHAPFPARFQQAVFVLFVHQSTSLAGLESTEEHNSAITIAWDRWGPDKSRMLRMTRNEPVWVCSVHGTRYVRLEYDNERGGWGGEMRLRTLDFNPLLVKRGGSSDRRTSEGLYVAGTVDVVSDSSSACEFVLASQPTVISAPRYYVDKITTALPYRDVLGHEVFNYEAVIIDEECLIGVKQVAADVFEQTVEFLCF